GCSASTRSSPSIRLYSTLHCGDGFRWPASISALASSTARRRDVPGASTRAGSSPSRRKGSPAQASARRAAAVRPSVASDSAVGICVVSCMHAAHPCAATNQRGRTREPPWASRCPSIPLLAPETAENRERVARLDLVDELAARLNLPVDATGELDGFVAVLGPGDHVRERPRDAVALLAELLGELVRLVEVLALDPHLPRRIAAAEEVLFDIRLRRLV